MPRKARIDAPGALHHIIARGIARTKIFKDKADYQNFLDRLGAIIEETGTRSFAWALLPNHLHMLLKTGQVPIATVMRRLLTGYAVSFNRRHRRYGHLFQNRYKSILCQEDTYLLELVRYIHLNPIRAGVVKDMKALEISPFCGHSVIMGKLKKDWQDVQWVLSLFDGKLRAARRRYRSFVEKGIALGRRKDLTGGGLIRSSGGWTAVRALRQADIFQKSDERILGDGDFVEAVLSQARERMVRKYALMANGYDFDKIALHVCEMIDLEPWQILEPGKEPWRVTARSLLCYWAVRELGLPMSELSRKLSLSLSGVSQSVKRGEKIARDNHYRLFEENLKK